MSVVPADWMPAAKMKALVWHWTAGGHKASALDVKHYHIIVEADGNLVRGIHSIKANEHPRPGRYAAHTRSFNTGVIGVSMACMLNARERPFDPGPHPMTEAQWDKLALVIADLCIAYRIPVSPQTVLSHAEVQGTLGIVQRGKWDTAILPFNRSYDTAKKCGDLMRRMVREAMA